MNRFPEAVESVKLIAGDGGRFEVKLNGKLIYSKLETGRFPELKEITAPLQEFLQVAV